MKTLLIILSVIILTAVACGIVILVLPQTDVYIYPQNDEIQIDQNKIIADIRFIDTQKAQDYFKGMVGIKNVEIKNYYNFLGKTAYFSQRIRIFIINSEPGL